MPAMDEPTYDAFSGQRAHKVTEQEAEEMFVAAVITAADREPVYVVVGEDAEVVVDRKAFLDRVEAFVPVLIDKGLGDAAIIVAGHPDEWETLREQVVPPADL